MSIITNVQKTVVVFLPNISTLTSSYNRLLIYKSFNGSSGTYSEITASVAAGATLLSTKKENFYMNGKSFSFYSNGTLKTVSFTTEQSAVDVAARIQAITGVTAASASGYIRLTSPTTGLNSTLEVKESSTAGLVMGFQAGSCDIGEAARFILSSSQPSYSLVDYNSADTYWYKYRLYHATTAAYSDYSSPFQARSYDGVTSTNLIYGTAQLMGNDGNPLEDIAVIVTIRQLGALVESKLIDGDKIVYKTDSSGRVAIPLVKGSKITVAVENTKLVRDIDVPTTGTSFSLFDPAVQQYDAFGISSYTIEDMVRVSF